MGLQSLRNACAGEVLDYGLLMSHLQKYKAPHRKITTMLKKAELIRVKKGLYVFGELYRRHPLNMRILANLIYGPYYVSKEYALSWHGLIPERVETVTSMTTKRNKEFETPLGQFSYDYINERRFTVGIDWVDAGQGQYFFMASPEKALADTVIAFREIKTQQDMLEHLTENMRIDDDDLDRLDINRLSKIEAAYRHPVVTLLLKTLQLKG